MELTIDSLLDLFGRHPEFVPKRHIFFIRTGRNEPAGCLLGLLDVEQRSVEEVECGVNIANLYVPRLAAAYDQSESFMLGLLYGWDFWDEEHAADYYDNPGMVAVDPDGFALGRAVGRRILGARA